LGIQWFLLISAFVIIIVGVFLISLILKARIVLISFDNLVKSTHESLIPLLNELREGAERINKIAKDIESTTRDVQHLTTAVGEMGAIIDGLNNFVKRTGLTFSIKTASIGVGIKTALSVLLKGLMKKAIPK